MLPWRAGGGGKITLGSFMLELCGEIDVYGVFALRDFQSVKLVRLCVCAGPRF